MGMPVLEVVLSELRDDEAPTFDAYVRARSVALRRFAYLVTRNHSDAEDVLQDALLGLYPRFDAVAAGGNVDAYVRRSIVNASVSRWRKVSRVSVTDTPEHWVRDPAPRGLDDAVVDAALAWDLCEELPPPQRAAVVLRFYDDLSFAEIAGVLGCPEATARSYVHRALTKLRTRLIGGDHD